MIKSKLLTLNDFLFFTELELVQYKFKEKVKKHLSEFMNLNLDSILKYTIVKKFERESHVWKTSYPKYSKYFDLVLDFDEVNRVITVKFLNPDL